jgi:hypothetical protein
MMGLEPTTFCMAKARTSPSFEAAGHPGRFRSFLAVRTTMSPGIFKAER